MKRTHNLLLGVAVAAVIAGCTSTPDKPIAELETARAVVPQVEASPRAGVAAENISNARKQLDAANQMMEKGGTVEDIRYQATLAATNAQIANERILEAQAKEELQKGEVERTQVLADARSNEAEQQRQRAASLEQELKDLKATKTDRGLVLTLGDVLFDTGKATLKPGAYSTIDRLAQALKEDPNRRVVIEGHTDSVGSDEFNQQLSENRAQSVQSALMQRGVAGSQMTAAGLGETVPVASNDNSAGRQQNRRVELIFTEEAGQRVATDQ